MDETERRLWSKHFFDRVVTRFDFPPLITTACEQYLIYFTQLLRDLGVEADADLQKVGNHVLFTIRPQDSDQSLSQIRIALDAYLRIPAWGKTEVLLPDSDLACVQLKRQVGNLQDQIVMLEETLQPLLLADCSTRIGESKAAEIAAAERPELILGGFFTLNTIRVIGGSINVAEIFRCFARLFSKDERPR